MHNEQQRDDDNQFALWERVKGYHWSGQGKINGEELRCDMHRLQGGKSDTGKDLPKGVLYIHRPDGETSDRVPIFPANVEHPDAAGGGSFGNWYVNVWRNTSDNERGPKLRVKLKLKQQPPPSKVYDVRDAAPSTPEEDIPF